MRISLVPHSQSDPKRPRCSFPRTQSTEVVREAKRDLLEPAGGCGSRAITTERAEQCKWRKRWERTTPPGVAIDLDCIKRRAAPVKG
jgi:hypothetical protein